MFLFENKFYDSRNLFCSLFCFISVFCSLLLSILPGLQFSAPLIFNLIILLQLVVSAIKIIKCLMENDNGSISIDEVVRKESLRITSHFS